MFERIATDAVTFFVVVNPVGLVPLFISATRQESSRERRSTALRGVLIAAVILIAFIVVGQLLLKALGVTLPSFRIAGGLVLLVISMKMILEEEPPGSGAEGGAGPSAGPPPDVAVFPLAMPFIAGPGTIMAAVLLTDGAKFSVLEQAVTTAVLLAVLAFTYGMLLLADPIHGVLKTAGANVLSRVMGLVLAGLSVEVILAGIRAAFSLG
jgi:multiple antibiotic resistance protein